MNRAARLRLRFRSASGADCARAASRARPEPHAGDGSRHRRRARRSFAEFPSLLNPGDLLVLNDTPRDSRAPLRAPHAACRDHEKPTGRIEVMLTEPVPNRRRKSLARPRAPGKKSCGRRAPGLSFASGAIELEAEVLERGEFGERLLRFEPVDDFFAVLDRIGHIPCRPTSGATTPRTDRERYQTVYSHERGSVAAPTAGLHFTPQMLDALTARGVEIARITLHVGLGTFAPLRVERLAEVRLHRERYTLPAAAAEAINRAVAESRRIVAVGTTVVRTLESAAADALQAQGTAVPRVPNQQPCQGLVELVPPPSSTPASFIAATIWNNSVRAGLANAGACPVK